ncbi:alpha-L-rhamnosidase [Paractinoplanes brasiliensis]|uniref:alpha-L-rhamnosidase n=1 Tax=Paractinoplanes brasiliensis TaxID=52695 RepID=A0A4R6JZ14_9ACTN|nr:alpha-L-rhamnosidase [Actinoplanes brasiliensis]TDO42133.1 alpha-L-rhamnosidase [Actinoplanes brasiliensis]GID32002.1 rhamnosidase [Actinoplanes brasiliensis]
MFRIRSRHALTLVSVLAAALAVPGTSAGAVPARVEPGSTGPANQLTATNANRTGAASANRTGTAHTYKAAATQTGQPGGTPASEPTAAHADRAAAPGGPAAPAPVRLDSAQWVWFPEGNPAQGAPAATRYLRRTFTAPAGPYTDAQLVVSGDDTVDVWLNDTYLGGSPRAADAWKQARYFDLAAALQPGANTLRVAARNTNAGPAGVIGRLRVASAAGTVDLVTDGGWQAANSVPESWVAARALGAYGMAPWGRNVGAPGSGASPVTVTGLTTERQSNPVGVDARQPRFGWRLGSGTNGQVQGRYQVTVGTRPDAADVWDSGQVASGQSVDVAYGGNALASDRTYHWRVRVWDTQGRPSPWSAPARFDTGLFDPAAEWQAQFIGAADGANLTGASWIWYPDGDAANSVPAGTRYFRRTFDRAAAGTPATLVVTGDDTADVWVNGEPVSTSRRVADSWKRATTVDVTARLRAGSNTVAIAATNTTSGPAGVIAKLGDVVTDGGWKASQSGPSGWQQPGFDDGSWAAARVGAAHGGGPWGSQVSVTAFTPYVSKGFDLGKPVARARLFATALGLHETFLNGQPVTAERLAPGWTDYNKRLQYRVYDVTAKLRTGGNTIGALVGNGWYSGNLGFAGSQRYGTRPWYSARLSVEYTDGTRADVRTDGSWTATASTIVSEDLYHGEDQDARITGTEGKPVTVRTDSQPNLVAQVDPGVTVQQEFRPKAITQPAPGVWIVDLGQNFAGWNRLTVTGAAGAKVTLRHGEILNADGTLYTANLRAAQATDTFTLAGTGEPEVFEPHFTVHGYRYVEVTGFPGTLTADNLTGRAAWTNGAGTGTFTTSDPLINQVQHNILWGARSNLLSIPTDCPQRDERLGWTGDIASFAATSTFGFDTHGLLVKFADDMVDAQRADGAFTDVAPAVIDGAGKAGWADAGVIVPYTIWQRYGDLAPAGKHFAAMAKYVDYLRSTAGADLIRNHETHGDWLNVDDHTPNDVSSTAFFGWSARLVARMAAATGRTAEAASYGALADGIAAAFTDRFVAADGTVGNNSQTGYVLALAFGLVPPARTQAVADKLVAKVDARSGHLSVGFMGVENLLPVLAEHGHAGTAYRILQQPGYPGWGYMNSRGATTIWERWDGIRVDGTLQDPGMNSFNHYGLGSVGDWLYRSVGGVAPASPGYRQVLIAPKPGGSLTAASSSLRSPYGVTSSSWTRSGSTLTLKVVVPPNATALVRVPAGAGSTVSAPPEAVPQGAGDYSVGSGAYTFTVRG